LRYLT